jgi:hypothetical protein
MTKWPFGAIFISGMDNQMTPERSDYRRVAQSEMTELTMADRATLGKIGYILGGMTMAVVMVGALVVGNHVSGRWSLDGVVTTSAAASTAR